MAMKILVVVREKSEADEIEKILQRIVPISGGDEMEREDCCKVVGAAVDGIRDDLERMPRSCYSGCGAF